MQEWSDLSQMGKRGANRQSVVCVRVCECASAVRVRASTRQFPGCGWCLAERARMARVRTEGKRVEVQVEGKGTTGLWEWAGAIWTWTQGFFWEVSF